MKAMLAICKDCGYKEQKEIFDREDAEKHHLRLVRPRCKKCGSYNVELVGA